MIAPCDGCYRIFNHSLTTINAKEWKPKVCNVSIDNSRHFKQQTYRSIIAWVFDAGEEHPHVGSVNRGGIRGLIVGGVITPHIAHGFDSFPWLTVGCGVHNPSIIDMPTCKIRYH